MPICHVYYQSEPTVISASRSPEVSRWTRELQGWNMLTYTACIPIQNSRDNGNLESLEKNSHTEWTHKEPRKE